VLDGREETTETAGYLKGARLGSGKAIAIARPTKLQQVPKILQAAVDAGCVVVVQGSNTGLTGGSVPRNSDGDERPTVIISMKNLDAIVPVDDGEKVFCSAGVGLASLKNFVAENFPDRQSHSTLGSNFLNPTTAAGVAFGSGGTQIRKGPSCTERALYLKVNEQGQVKVVNTLGIKDLDSQEGEFEFVSDNDRDGVIPDLDSFIDTFDGATVQNDKNFRSNATYGTSQSHVTNYKNILCTINDNLTRFNADTEGLECNRSEGKVLILATIHDTFKSPSKTKSYWISFEDLETATQFKTQVCLANPDELPESIEYMDRGCFEIIDQAGRLMGHFIKMFGADSPLVNKGWDIKLKIEALPGLAKLPDTLQYHINNLFPAVLPKAVMELGRAQNRHHHILTTMGDYGDGSLDSFEERFNKFRKHHERNLDVHELTSPSENNGANAFRYVAAAAFQTYCVGKNLEGISVDYALPKNDSRAPTLPPSTKDRLAKRMRYSHFACNVVHEDLAYERGADAYGAKMELKRVVDEERGGGLPSEHGHGTEYVAPPQTKKRWMEMDPLNVMNPGLGGLSAKYQYK